jgi:hypothetical protein
MFPPDLIPVFAALQLLAHFLQALIPDRCDSVLCLAIAFTASSSMIFCSAASVAFGLIGPGSAIVCSFPILTILATRYPLSEAKLFCHVLS